MYINQLIKAVNKYGKTNFLKHQSLVFLQDECQASQKHFHSQLNQMMTEPNGIISKFDRIKAIKESNNFISFFLLT